MRKNWNLTSGFYVCVFCFVFRFVWFGFFFLPLFMLFFVFVVAAVVVVFHFSFLYVCFFFFLFFACLIYYWFCFHLRVAKQILIGYLLFWIFYRFLMAVIIRKMCLSIPTNKDRKLEFVHVRSLLSHNEQSKSHIGTLHCLLKANFITYQVFLPPTSYINLFISHYTINYHKHNF